MAQTILCAQYPKEGRSKEQNYDKHRSVVHEAAWHLMSGMGTA